MKTLASTFLLCLLLCGAAAAQKYEISVSGGYPSISHTLLGSLSPDTPKDTDTTIRGEYSYGIRVTRNTRGYYGHEIGYTFNRAKLNTVLYAIDENNTTFAIPASARIPVHQVFYNFLIYFMPSGERWRPFITGGAHAIQYGSPNLPSFPDRSRHYGFNWGGGLKLRLFPHTFARLDARQYLNGRPYGLNYQDITKTGGWMHQWETSAGVGISF